MSTCLLRRFSIFVVGVAAISAVGCSHARFGNPLAAFQSRNRVAGGKDNKIAKATKGLKNPEKTHLAYARWQEQLGNLVEARSSYQMALNHDSRSTDAIIGLARLDQLAGRMGKAEQGYQKALKMQPNNPQAHDALGQFYANQEDWAQALDHLNAAMMAAPDATSYRHHLAVALARSGRAQESLPHFVKTVGEAEAHYNLGYILYEQGNLSGAKEHLTQAVLKKPGLAVAQQMLDQVNEDVDAPFMASTVSEAPKPMPEVEQHPLGSGKVSLHSRPNIPEVEPIRQASRIEGWGPTQQSQRPAELQPRLRSNIGLSAPSPTGTPDSTLTPEQLEQMKNQSGTSPF